MAEKMNRREFLQSGAAGLGSFFLVSSPEKPGIGVGKKERKFAHRTLAKTGIRVPVINMGVMNTDNPNLVRAALQGGMTFLDTAQTYQRGQNEGMIGEILKGRPRDSYFLATKARLPSDQKTGIYKEGATEEAYTRKIDQSLKSLGLDYVDIYYHHNVWARESAFYEPILRALEKAKKAGKTRFAGITTHRNEPEVIRAAVDSKFYDVVLTTYNFKQKHYPEVRKAIAEAAAAGVAVVAMKPLGGKEIMGGREPIDPKAALKWVLQDPNVHTVVTGFTTFDQLELDLAVLEDYSLTSAEKAHLRRAFSQVGLYCQGCGQCLQGCARELPIPDLMRAYMYAYGYRNASAAQELVVSLELPLNACGDCETCSVKCASGFNVRARIRNVVRLRDVPPEFLV